MADCKAESHYDRNHNGSTIVMCGRSDRSTGYEINKYYRVKTNGGTVVQIQLSVVRL